MSVPHSCVRFLDPGVQPALEGLLERLAGDITLILACPGVPDWGKLDGIQSLADECAPAPDPQDGIRWAGDKPEPGSACEELIEYITAVRRLLVHTSMLSRDRLDEIGRLSMVTLSHQAARRHARPVLTPVR